MSRGKDRDVGKIGAAEQGALFGTAEPADHKAGHRQRLRDRFRNGGADAIPDYELLEMILFRVFPRGDTKPGLLLRSFRRRPSGLRKWAVLETAPSMN